MSIGDIKGFRRRQIIQARAGHFPRRSSVSTQESIARNAAQAARERSRQAKKK